MDWLPVLIHGQLPVVVLLILVLALTGFEVKAKDFSLRFFKGERKK